MEQGDLNNSNNKQPKMPRFNMSWLYITILVGLIFLFMTGGGNLLGGSAAQKASYTEFKDYVNRGYALNVVINKDESTLKMYVQAKYCLLYTF